MIYFDHNATTQPDGRVVEAMMPYLHQAYGNPSSIYRFGRVARSAMDTAREQVAALVGASPADVIFTSGGTEANALALAAARGRRLVISAIEHPSVSENALQQAACYQEVNILPVDSNGIVCEEALVQLHLQRGNFVSVMLANNETGAIQNIRSLVESLADRGVIMHSDAVQALGKIPFSFEKLGLDLMSVSSHKIYGPKGCGAVVRKAGMQLNPLFLGGGQEQGIRAGTENVAAIVGFGKAAELAKLEFGQRVTKMQGLRSRLEQQLRNIPDVVIFAEHVQRLPNTVQFGLSGINGEMLLMQLDRHNIAVSSGSACAMGSEQISPVLAAMAVDKSLAKSAIRISLGKDNTESEIDQFIAVLRSMVVRH